MSRRRTINHQRGIRGCVHQIQNDDVRGAGKISHATASDLNHSRATTHGCAKSGQTHSKAINTGHHDGTKHSSRCSQLVPCAITAASHTSTMPRYNQLQSSNSTAVVAAVAGIRATAAYHRHRRG